MSRDNGVDRKYSTDKLTTKYAHVGLYDVARRDLWIARKRFGMSPIRVSHARLLVGGGQNASTAEKDRFICYSFFTPGSGQGYVQGYPIEWEEGHLIVRPDPNWNYLTGRLVPPTDTAQLEKIHDQQFEWGKRVFESYLGLAPKFPISWHMIGARATDSMFYIRRVEPADD